MKKREVESVVSDISNIHVAIGSYRKYLTGDMHERTKQYFIEEARERTKQRFIAIGKRS